MEINQQKKNATPTRHEQTRLPWATRALGLLVLSVALSCSSPTVTIPAEPPAAMQTVDAQQHAYDIAASATWAPTARETIVPTLTATSKPSETPPPAFVSEMRPDPYVFGEINLNGSMEGEKLQPAPPVFFFLPDGKGGQVMISAHPKALEATDDQSKVWDPNGTVNPVTLNVTKVDPDNNPIQAIAVQTVHSGRLQSNQPDNPFIYYPAEKALELLEGAPYEKFTLAQFNQRAQAMVGQVLILQGNLQPGVKVDSIKPDATGLVSPTVTNATVLGIGRMSPVGVDKLALAYANANGKYINQFDYIDQGWKPADFNPQTDFAIEFCSWPLKGEKEPAGRPRWEAARDFIFIRTVPHTANATPTPVP